MPPAMVTAEMTGRDLIEWATDLGEESYRLVVDDMTQEHRLISLGQLRRAIQTSSISFLEVLQGGDRPFSLTREQLAVVRETARREFPLRDMVRGLRIVQRHWTEVLLDLIERCLPEPERHQRARRMLDVLTRFFDDTIDSVMVEYLGERQRLLGCALSARREMLLRLLAGEPAEDAGTVLGIDLAHHHLALALPGVGDHLERLERQQASPPALAEEVSAALRADGELVVPGTDHEQWIWVSSPRPFAEDHVASVRAILSDQGYATCGIGRPGPGRRGLCDGLADARDALRIARRRPSGSERIVAFAEVRLTALLSADPLRAQRFVREELGELAADQPAMAELRVTLRTYYESEQSLVKTAARLFLHRNTVVYRLRRIEQGLGHPVGAEALEVHAALCLMASLGAAAPG